MPSNSEEILAVAYLEPSRTSTMELFGENRLRLKAVNTFHENDSELCKPSDSGRDAQV